MGSVSRSRFSPSIHESEECIPHHFIHHGSLELATLLWEVCWEVLSTHSLACCLNSWLRPPKGSHSLSIEQQGKGSCFNEESFNSQTGKFLLPKWSCIVYFNVTMRGILLSMSLIPCVLARAAGAHCSGMNGCQQVWMRVFLTLHTLRNFTKTQLNLTIWLHTFPSVSWITFTANVCFPQSFQLRDKDGICLSHALFCNLGDLNICRWAVVVVLLKAGAC